MVTAKYYPNYALGYADVDAGQDADYYGGQWKRYCAPSGMLMNDLPSGKVRIHDTCLDFYIPDDQRLDPAIYQITAAKLYIYPLDFYPRASIFQTTQTLINTGLYLRNAVSSLRQPQLQLADTPSNMSAVHGASAGYLSGSSLAISLGSWSVLTLTSSFYSQFMTYQYDGFVSLVLRRTAQTTGSGGFFALSGYGSGLYAPYLEITYQPIASPPVFVSFATDGAPTQVWGSQAQVNMTVKDTEEETQALKVRGTMQMNGVPINKWVWLPVTDDAGAPGYNITTSKYGTASRRTVNIPFRRNSLATPSGWTYWRTFRYQNATFSPTAGTISFSANTAQIDDVSTPLAVNTDLKPNTVYRLGVTYSTTGGLVPVAKISKATTGAPIEERFLTGSYNPAVRSTYVEWNSNLDTIFTPLIKASGTGGTVTISEVILTEATFDPTPWTVTLEAQLTDNDGTAASGIQFQTDARKAPAPRITETGSLNEVFHISPQAAFTWQPPNTQGATIAGYCYAINSDPAYQVSAGDLGFTTTTAFNYTFPWDDKWYFHVAAQTTNGIIGETGHYGFWYNVPSTFNSASGVACDGVRLSTTKTEWVRNNTQPLFTWNPPTQPSAQTTYQLQVGISGGVASYTTPAYFIDWEALPVNAGLQCRLYVHDMAGIKYLDRTTVDLPAKWDVFDQVTKTWKSWQTELAALARSSLPNTRTAEGMPKYSHVRYRMDTSDAVPDDLGYYGSLAPGYYDSSSGYLWDTPAQPQGFAFSAAPGVSGVLASACITVPDSKYLKLDSQFSTDGFARQTLHYTSQDYPRAFTEVYRHDYTTRLALYFNNGWQCDATAVLGTSVGTVSTVAARSAVTGGKALKFMGNSWLNMGTGASPGTESFTVSFWMRVPPNGYTLNLVKKLAGSVGWSISMNSSGYLILFMGDGTRTNTLTSATYLYDNVGTWTHVAVQFDRTAGPVLWLGGIKNQWLPTPTAITGTLTNAAQLQIGGSTEVTFNKDAYLDDVLIHQRLLSPEEIGWLAGWNYEQRLLGPERPFSAYGLQGNGKPRTVRLNARREFGLATGSYSYRWTQQFDMGDVVTSSVSTKTLANAPLITYTWSFLNPELDAAGITQPQYKPVADLQMLASVYMIRLRVFDGFQWSDWSPRWKFRINRKPSPPSNLLIQ